MSVRTLARRTGILLAAVYLLAPFIRCEDNAVELWKMLSPIASGGCQAISGPEAQDTYTIGVIAGLSDPGEPLKVFEVTGDGPAAMAGIQKGDSLWGTDAKGDPLVIDACELLRREASGTENLALYRKPSDQQQQTKVTAQPRRRREVFPGDSRMQWKVISGYMDGGRFRVSGALARGSLGDFELRLGIYNLQTEKLLQLDESKIFLLDEQGTEFTHQSFTDWKQSLEALIASANALANGMEPIPYLPQHTPPPAHYHISTSSDGTYMLTPLGGNAYEVSGNAQSQSTVSPEYTPTEQVGQAARSIASIVQAIRIARTNKEIISLRRRAAANAEAAQKLLADGTASHLEAAAPIPPGARRTGAVAFVQPKNLGVSVIKAIVVVSDASTKKEYFVTFRFAP